MNLESKDEVLQWLLSPEGSDVAAALRDRFPHSPVVVELHADGFVAVYGETDPQSVSVKVVNRVKTNSNHADRLAEDLVGITLRGKHRAVYFPGNVIATGQVEAKDPDQIAERMTSVAVSQSLERLAAVACGLAKLRTAGGRKE